MVNKALKKCLKNNALKNNAPRTDALKNTALFYQSSQHISLNWYKVTGGLLYPLSIKPPFAQIGALTVKISSVTRAQEGIYVAIFKFRKSEAAVHAFQIFVEEVCSLVI